MTILPTYPEAGLWLLLGIAVISLLAELRLTWLLLAVFLVCAVFLSRISVIGAGTIAIGFALAFSLSPHIPEKFDSLLGFRSQVVLNIGLLAWCIAMASHIAPGFNNMLVLDAVTSGPESAPFTLFFNLDKPLITFALVLAFPAMLDMRLADRFGSVSFRATRISFHQWGMLVVSFGSIVVLAFASPVIQPELSFPDWWWLFAFNNLLFTCAAEEALFRGYLQSLLVRITNNWLGIGLASIIFGAAHFPGGPSIMLFAGLAGLLYGLVYQFTGRLIAAIGMHFAVNMMHLVIFTYPVPIG
jgi:membrane protease YdiL (CAAX protease family)